MSETKTLTISILDKQYRVSCAANEVADLKRSAEFLDDRMREMKEKSNVVGLDRLAVMVALNIANELLGQAVTQAAVQAASQAATQGDGGHDALQMLADKVDSASNLLKEQLGGKAGQGKSGFAKSGPAKSSKSKSSQAKSGHGESGHRESSHRESGHGKSGQKQTSQKASDQKPASEKSPRKIDDRKKQPPSDQGDQEGQASLL